jgi:hypothetical protein
MSIRLLRRFTNLRSRHPTPFHIDDMQQQTEPPLTNRHQSIRKSTQSQKRTAI